MGTFNLRTVQFGRESTWGTSVAAAAIMSGVQDASLDLASVNTPIRVLDGTLVPSQTALNTYQTATAEIKGYFTGEDFLYLADSGIKGSVSPTGTNPYTWTYTFPTTAVGSVRSRTLEFYDGTQEWEMSGGLVESFTLSGNVGTDTLAMFTSKWVGKTAVQATVTGALSVRSFQAIPANNFALYYDTFGGTVKSTAQANTLVNWEFTCDTGIHLKKFADATVTPSTFGYDLMKITLKLTVEANAAGEAMANDAFAGTRKLISVSGTNGSTAGLDVQGAFIPDGTVKLWENRDGNTIMTIPYTATNDSATFANYTKIIVTNAVSALVTNA